MLLLFFPCVCVWKCAQIENMKYATTAKSKKTYNALTLHTISLSLFRSRVFPSASAYSAQVYQAGESLGARSLSMAMVLIDDICTSFPVSLSFFCSTHQLPLPPLPLPV